MEPRATENIFWVTQWTAIHMIFQILNELTNLRRNQCYRSIPFHELSRWKPNAQNQRIEWKKAESLVYFDNSIRNFNKTFMQFHKYAAEIITVFQSSKTTWDLVHGIFIDIIRTMHSKMAHKRQNLQNTADKQTNDLNERLMCVLARHISIISLLWWINGDKYYWGM